MMEQEPLDAESHQCRESFARFGVAMYYAQCVEKSLAILVSSVFEKRFLPGTLEERDALQDEVFARAMGKLIRRLRTQVTVPPDLAQSLEDARRKRNWLAHNYFWERAGEALSPEGRERVIEELIELQQFFADLDHRLVRIYERYAERVGITKEAREMEFQRLIEEGRRA